MAARWGEVKRRRHYAGVALVLMACAVDERNPEVGVGANAPRPDPAREASSGEGSQEPPGAGSPERSADAGVAEVAASDAGASAMPPARPPPALQPAPTCGNFRLNPGELCDDGNVLSGDGCSSDCLRIEPGFACQPGALCIQAEVCGDGVLELRETCDDGNDRGGDGCAAHCRAERGFACPTPGQLCRAGVCGDSLVATSETCDDGNLVAGDGCSTTCQLENGFLCPVPGTQCLPACTSDCTPGLRCGDELVASPESCDNGVNESVYEFSTLDCAPGCVRPPRCGDGFIDPSFGERCDDGVNDGSYGGCNADCSLGPRCGDAQIDVGEECDDANRRNGDGCNLACQLER